MALLKSFVVLSAWSLAEALAPGDCAFVGMYGDDDDFALVLMEDVDGESISLTEGSPSDADFHIDQWATAKHYVSDLTKGSVLKRSDFQTDTASFLAPTALSAFKGSAESPTVLCSIILESRPLARKLQSVVVMLSSMETAEALRGVAAAFMTSDQQNRDAQAAQDLWRERDVDGNLKEAEESMFPTWLAYPFIDLKNTILHPERYDEALAEVRRRGRQEEHERQKSLADLGT